MALEIDLNEVLAQLSPAGVREWELAVLRAENIKMKEHIDSFEEDDLGQDNK
tara:strand:- start:7932 stop:8087 length:156 start_codon:yes stop_codon:yes gene_type:complete